MPSLQTELQSKSTGTNVFKALAYTIIPNYNTQMIKKKQLSLQNFKLTKNSCYIIVQWV